MSDEKLMGNIKNVEEAREIAKRYAKENNLKLGKYEKGLKGITTGDYCFCAGDPRYKDMLVGLPLHICVESLTGAVLSERFL